MSGARRGFKPAFTLVEVLVAVAVLSLVATAALKLVMLAQNGLAQSRPADKLLADAVMLQTEIRLGASPVFGRSGDISWNVSERTSDGFDENFGRLDFGRTGHEEMSVPWRELTVTKDSGEKIILYLPPSGVTQDAGTAEENVSEK